MFLSGHSVCSLDPHVFMEMGRTRQSDDCSTNSLEGSVSKWWNRHDTDHCCAKCCGPKVRRQTPSVKQMFLLIEAGVDLVL
jgi:hypothetical protein